MKGLNYCNYKYGYYNFKTADLNYIGKIPLENLKYSGVALRNKNSLDNCLESISKRQKGLTEFYKSDEKGLGSE